MPEQVPPASVVGEAEYILETPLKCPLCRQEITSFLVVRLLRSRVNFVSTLPRRGYVIICPACQGIITAELAVIA